MVSFSNEAISDLMEIRAWIAQDNPRLATEKALLIRQKCEILDASPELGRAVSGGKREL